MYFQVYYPTALLQHISVDISNSSGELKTPKKNYHNFPLVPLIRLIMAFNAR
jgi:hypothetical protein